MKTSWFVLLSALVIAATLSFGSLLAAARPRPVMPTTAARQTTPLLFIQNVGQFADDVRFQAYGAASTLFATHDSLWFTAFGQSPAAKGTDARQPTPGVALRVRFAGANPNAQIEPFNEQGSHISYFLGDDANDWHADVPVWSGIRYTNLYPNMDLELTSANGRLIERMIMHPGADPRAVRLEVDGADVALAGDALRLQTSVGAYTLPLVQLVAADGAPMAAVQAAPAVQGNTISAPFSMVANARASDAPQDTTDLIYGAIFGGNGYERGGGIATDATGAAYITGFTESADFPRTTGDFFSGGQDAFVAKVNASGTVLNYATFLGGSGIDQGAGIAVRGNEAYVTGFTESKNFPTRGVPSDDTSFNGDSDAFVAKLNSTGGRVYATYLGGKSDDRGFGIAVDQSGAAYVTGATSSADFPVKNAINNAINGRDAFAVKFDTSGNRVYSTFLGGSDYDRGDGTAVDAAGNMYILGTTASADLPTTSNAYDRAYNGSGDDDLFITKLNASGSQALYTTFLGGSSDDFGSPGVAVDDNGNVYVTGDTQSANFPTTSGAYDQSYNGGDDAFVAMINTRASGTASLAYSTFLGGANNDKGNGLAVSSDGQVYVGGETSSADFPTTSNAYDQSYSGGPRDIFMARLNPAGAGNADLRYGTFIGGNDDENGGYLALDRDNNVYLTGYTKSSNFPTTAVLDAAASGGNVFAVKLGGAASEPPLPPTSEPPTDTPTPSKTPRPGDTPVPTANATSTAKAQATEASHATATAIQSMINTAVAATVGAATASAEIQTATAVGATIVAENATATAEAPAQEVTATAAAGTAVADTATAIALTNVPGNPPAQISDKRNAYLPMVDRPAFIPPTATPVPTATPAPTACPDAEDNDTPDQARQLMAPTFCTGSLQDDPQGEDDYYWIDMAVGQHISMVLSGIPTGADYDLILYTPSLDLAAVSNQSGASAETIDYTVQKSGRFFIRINMATKASTGNNAYLLRIDVR
jgi:hypothetical protein